MVKLIASILILILSPLQAATLKLHLSHDQVEMGKSIMATFTFIGKEQPNEINLSAWNDNFFIEHQDPNHSVSPTGENITTFKSRLYPRSIGQKTLDAIALSGRFVRPHKVIVKPSIRNSIDATPKLMPLKRFYWTDESIEIAIKVPLHYPGNEVVAKEWIVDGMTISPLPSIKTDTYVLLKWLLYTPFKGLKIFELPVITQRGHGRFRFHLPLVETTIRPLPSYYPNSIATGKIDINSRIVSINEKKSVEIKLSKIGYLPEHIEGLDSFLLDLSKNEIHLNKSIKETIIDGVTTRYYQYELPEWLILHQLKFKLLFFNTETKQLDSIEHLLPKVTTLPSYAKYSVIAIALFIFILLFKILLLAIKTKQHYNNIRTKISNVSSAPELRKILILAERQNKISKYKSKQLDSFITCELEPICFQKQIVSQKKLEFVKSQAKKLI